MKLVNHTYRALLVLLACTLSISYSAIPHARQVTDSKCVISKASPTDTSLGPNLAPNQALKVNPQKPSRPLGWFPSSYGSNNPDFKYMERGHAGKRGLRVDMYEHKDGAANWMFEDQPVTAGQQYYFSDSYKSDVNTEVEASFTMSDGSIKYSILGFVAPSKDWANFRTTFTVPVGAKKLAVYHYIDSNGYLTTSDYSLRPYTPKGFDHPMLTLTFDDGFRSAYRNGLPLMNKYNLKSTQFIITSLIDSKRYMTKAQVRDWISHGHEIGSHTVTHNNLTAESPAGLSVELRKSKDTLSSVTHNYITDFAYPMGAQNDEVKKVVASQYSAARGVEAGLNAKDNFDCYNLKAQNIHNDTTPEQVADWIIQAKNTNSWLILVYHSVEPDKSTKSGKSRFNVTPARLESHLKVIKASGIKVRTMAESINAINEQVSDRYESSAPKRVNKQNLIRLKG